MSQLVSGLDSKWKFRVFSFFSTAVGSHMWYWVFPPKLITVWLLHWSPGWLMGVWHRGWPDRKKKGLVCDHTRNFFIRARLHTGTRDLLFYFLQNRDCILWPGCYYVKLCSRHGNCWAFSAEFCRIGNCSVFFIWMCSTGHFGLFNSWVADTELGVHTQRAPVSTAMAVSMKCC